MLVRLGKRPATSIFALGIQLGVDDVVVDELDQPQHSGQVVLHIGDLDITERLHWEPVLEPGTDAGDPGSGVASVSAKLYSQGGKINGWSILRKAT